MANNELSGAGRGDPTRAVARVAAAAALHLPHRVRARDSWAPSSTSAATSTPCRRGPSPATCSPASATTASTRSCPRARGNTLADRVARQSLPQGFVEYSFLERGSDERQYCAPGVDLPVASVMRNEVLRVPRVPHLARRPRTGGRQRGSRAATTPCGPASGRWRPNRTYRSAVLCEPQLGRRGLYPTLSTLETRHVVRDLKNVWAFSDGTRDTVAVAEQLGLPVARTWPVFNRRSPTPTCSRRLLNGRLALPTRAR